MLSCDIANLIRKNLSREKVKNLHYKITIKRLKITRVDFHELHLEPCRDFVFSLCRICNHDMSVLLIIIALRCLVQEKPREKHITIEQVCCCFLALTWHIRERRKNIFINNSVHPQTLSITRWYLEENKRWMFASLNIQNGTYHILKQISADSILSPRLKCIETMKKLDQIRKHLSTQILSIRKINWKPTLRRQQKWLKAKISKWFLLLWLQENV